MNKILKTFVTMLLIVFLIGTVTVFATENQETENVVEDLLPYENPELEINDVTTDYVLPKYKEGDVFISTENADIKESIAGDVYILSETANITSTIKGNVFICASNINISGRIEGDVFAVAEDVTIEGSVESIYIMANNINIKDSAEIRCDAKILANDFDLTGIIYRNLSIMAENIKIEKGTGPVRGNINYIGNLDADKSSILGEITKYEFPEVNTDVESDVELFMSVLIDVLNKLIFVTTMITGFFIIIILVLLFNKKSINRRQIGCTEYIKDTGLGLVYSIGVFVIAFLLIATLVGIPLAFILLALYWVVACMAIPAISIEIANKIFKKDKTSKLAIIGLSFLILIILELIKKITIIGGIVDLITTVLGIRLIVRNILEKDNKDVEVEVISTEPNKKE